MWRGGSGRFPLATALYGYSLIDLTGAGMMISSKRLVLAISVFVLLLFSFAFATAPLYRWYCEVAGINQIKPSEKAVLAKGAVVNDLKDTDPSMSAREVKVEFDATIHESLKGIVTTFHSLTPNLKLNLGEVHSLYYIVKNNSNAVLITQAVPSITPWWGSEHFKKIECFCFKQQTLNPGEEKEMELKFYLDKDFPADIQTVTLSYTLMKAKEGSNFAGAANNKS